MEPINTTLTVRGGDRFKVHTWFSQNSFNRQNKLADHLCSHVCYNQSNSHPGLPKCLKIGKGGSNVHEGQYNERRN
jgi:hypothetical protein